MEKKEVVMKNKKEKDTYSVYADSHDVWIVKNCKNNHIVEDANFGGCFDIFTHAKNQALMIISIRIANFKLDHEKAKYNKAELLRTTKEKM